MQEWQTSFLTQVQFALQRGYNKSFFFIRYLYSKLLRLLHISALCISTAFPLYNFSPKSICPVVTLLQNSLSPVVSWALEKSPLVMFKSQKILHPLIAKKSSPSCLPSRPRFRWILPTPMRWSFLASRLFRHSASLNKTSIRSNTLNIYFDFKTLMYMGPTVYLIPENDISWSRTPINI